MNLEPETQFAQFQADICSHTVTVLRDDGLYRHLRCSAGSYHMQFEVVTWPGYLAYAGDMGSYVFSRLPDMFEFFRGRRQAVVGVDYLAEKAVAEDKPDGIREYSEALFRDAVKHGFDDFVAEHKVSTEDAAALWRAIEDDVLSRGDNHNVAVEAALRFGWRDGRAGNHRGRAVFPDFWERRLEAFTPRFIWCCYAIPWAIERYDAINKGEAAMDDVKDETVPVNDPPAATDHGDGAGSGEQPEPAAGEEGSEK